MFNVELIDHFRQLFLSEIIHYDRLVRLARKKIKSRTIHDLRVSSQKMALYLDLQTSILDQAQAKDFSKKKKKIVNLKKRMSLLRDLYVQRKVFLGYFSKNRNIGKFFQKKIGQEKDKLAPLLKIKKVQLPKKTNKSNYEKKWNVFYERLVFDFYRKLSLLQESHKSEDFHAFRKCLKRLMYLTEIFIQLQLPIQIKLEILKLFQKKLGNVQDLTASLTILNKMLKDSSHIPRESMIDFRKKNQVDLNSSMKSTMQSLERSSLWQN